VKEKDSRDWQTEIRSISDICPGKCQGSTRHTVVKLLLVHLQEAYSSLGRSMFQRVRTAGGVLFENCWKIQLQRLSSFLYASKRCSSMGSHGIFFLVLERPCSSLLEHPSSSLLESGSLSLKPPSRSLLEGSLPRGATAPAASTALLYQSWDRVASLWTRFASATVNTVVPLDGSRDDVCRLKPVKRTSVAAAA